MPTPDATADHRGRPWRRFSAVVVVVTLGVAAYCLQRPEVVGDATSQQSAVSDVDSSGAAREAVRAAPVRGMPTRVVIPALRVSAPVVPIKAVGRVLIPPSDPRQLGWWAGGARPGDRGSALITGHTVHTGGGALDHLDDLVPGDHVRVQTSRGWIDYRVRRVDVYSKGMTAERARQLFSQSVSGRLVLVTCTDWDGTRYLSNAVVTAAET